MVNMIKCLRYFDGICSVLNGNYILSGKTRINFGKFLPGNFPTNNPTVHSCLQDTLHK